MPDENLSGTRGNQGNSGNRSIGAIDCNTVVSLSNGDVCLGAHRFPGKMVLGKKTPEPGAGKTLCTFEPSDTLIFKYEGPRKHVPTTLTISNTQGKRVRLNSSFLVAPCRAHSHHHALAMNQVAFKVKTTNPKKYSVRPSSGFLDGNASKDIIITLNASSKSVDPAFIENCRDKFLIQTTMVDKSTKAVSSELFDNSNGLQQHKLRVQMISMNPVSPVAEGVEEAMHTPGAGTGRVTFAMDTYAESMKMKNRNAATSRGFGVLHLVLVTLLAFALGYFFKGQVVVLDWIKGVVEKKFGVALGLAEKPKGWF